MTETFIFSYLIFMITGCFHIFSDLLNLLLLKVKFRVVTLKPVIKNEHIHDEYRSPLIRTKQGCRSIKKNIKTTQTWYIVRCSRSINGFIVNKILELP